MANLKTIETEKLAKRSLKQLLAIIEKNSKYEFSVVTNAMSLVKKRMPSAGILRADNLFVNNLLEAHKLLSAKWEENHSTFFYIVSVNQPHKVTTIFVDNLSELEAICENMKKAATINSKPKLISQKGANKGKKYNLAGKRIEFEKFEEGEVVKIVIKKKIVTGVFSHFLKNTNNAPNGYAVVKVGASKKIYERVLHRVFKASLTDEQILEFL